MGVSIARNFATGQLGHGVLTWVGDDEENDTATLQLRHWKVRSRDLPMMTSA